MTQEETNYFVALFVKGFTEEGYVFEGKQEGKSYQNAKIPLGKVDYYDTFVDIFEQKGEKYPEISHYFHCEKLKETHRGQFEESFNHLIEQYHLEMTLDMMDNKLNLRVTEHAKEEIRKDLVGDMIEKKVHHGELMNESIIDHVVALESEMKHFVKEFSVMNFLSRVFGRKDRSLESSKKLQLVTN